MTNAEVEQTEPKTLLEELHILDAYLVERAERRGPHENGAMAYENSARLLRNILKGRTEPQVDNIGVDAILNDLSALDDEFLTSVEREPQLPVRKAYRKAASKVRALIEKHRIEPEFEWGIQYTDGNDHPHEYWGFSRDPRLPAVIDGVEYRPIIEPDGVVYLTDDPSWVTAVAKRPKTVRTEPWEEYKA